MVFRCELCDSFLPLLQLSHLCPTCYKIRTITKCYSTEKILKCLEENFLVNNNSNQTSSNLEIDDSKEENDDDYYDKNFQEEFKNELKKMIGLKKIKKEN